MKSMYFVGLCALVENFIKSKEYGNKFLRLVAYRKQESIGIWSCLTHIIYGDKECTQKIYRADVLFKCGITIKDKLKD